MLPRMGLLPLCLGGQKGQVWHMRDVADHLDQESQEAESQVVFDPGGPMATKDAAGLVMTAEVVRVGRAAMALHPAVIATKLFGRASPARLAMSPKRGLSFRLLPETLLPTS